LDSTLPKAHYRGKYIEKGEFRDGNEKHYCHCPCGFYHRGPGVSGFQKKKEVIHESAQTRKDCGAIAE
jgi:hypothetical protein